MNRQKLGILLENTFGIKNIRWIPSEYTDDFLTFEIIGKTEKFRAYSSLVIYSVQDSSIMEDINLTSSLRQKHNEGKKYQVSKIY